MSLITLNLMKYDTHSLFKRSWFNLPFIVMLFLFVYSATAQPIVINADTLEVFETRIQPGLDDSDGGMITVNFNGNTPGQFIPSGIFSASSSPITIAGGFTVTVSNVSTGYVGVANGRTIFRFQVDLDDGDIRYTQFENLEQLPGDTVKLNFGVDVFDSNNSSAPVSVIVHVINDAIATPVELSYIDLRSQEDAIHVFWETASETNNKGFSIERSFNGALWDSIGYKAGVGTSVNTQSYSFIDHQPVEGEVYYRLKQIDFNGDVSYSPIRSILYAPGRTTPDINVFPNPVSKNGSITIDTNDDLMTQVDLYTLDGQHHAQWIDTANTQVIALNNIKPGVYLLRVQYANYSTMSRIVVQ